MPYRQGVAEQEGKHDREAYRGGVAPAECGGDHHAEHLADRAAGQAVQRRLHRAAPEGGRFVVHGVVLALGLLEEALFFGWP